VRLNPRLKVDGREAHSSMRINESMISVVVGSSVIFPIVVDITRTTLTWKDNESMAGQARTGGTKRVNNVLHAQITLEIIMELAMETCRLMGHVGDKSDEASVLREVFTGRTNLYLGATDAVKYHECELHEATVLRCTTQRMRNRKTIFQDQSFVGSNSVVEYEYIHEGGRRTREVGMIVSILTIHNATHKNGKLKAQDVCGVWFTIARMNTIEGKSTLPYECCQFELNASHGATLVFVPASQITAPLFAVTTKTSKWSMSDCEISQDQLYYVIHPARIQGECGAYNEWFPRMNTKENSDRAKVCCFMTEEEHFQLNIALEEDVIQIKAMDSDYTEEHSKRKDTGEER